nr:hypothetical protein Muribac2_240 [uncultured Muribaculaceae bacterium]
MASILKSKAAAWGAMILVVLVIILTFSLRPAWWAFIDEFFMFMAVFCQLVALYLWKLNPYVGKKLQTFAMYFGILMVIALIGEYIAYQVLI